MLDPTILGANNTLGSYALVLAAYACLFVIIRSISSGVSPDFRRSFIALFIGWSFGTFSANYGLSRIGLMSFMPWANNFIHTFIWIGLCLGYLYAGVYRRSMIEQFALFAIFSFIVKFTEFTVLGTWEHDHFFFIPGHTAYIVGWSLADGLYPIISLYGLRLIAKVYPAFQTPVVEPARA